MACDDKTLRQYSVHLKLNTQTLHKLDAYCQRHNKKRNTLLNAFIAREIDRAIRLELAQLTLNLDYYGKPEADILQD